ncbi:MAG: hypothetical protein CMB64_04655 [Euryarchaeota archaeon]|nr:hypothetical protein [Euryarchaeota archaeon]
MDVFTDRISHNFVYDDSTSTTKHNFVENDSIVTGMYINIIPRRNDAYDQPGSAGTPATAETNQKQSVYLNSRDGTTGKEYYFSFGKFEDLSSGVANNNVHFFHENEAAACFVPGIEYRIRAFYKHWDSSGTEQHPIKLFKTGSTLIDHSLKSDNTLDQLLHGTGRIPTNSDSFHVRFDSEDINEYIIRIESASLGHPIVYIKAKRPQASGQIKIRHGDVDSNIEVSPYIGKNNFINTLPKFVGGPSSKLLKIKSFENMSVHAQLKLSGHSSIPGVYLNTGANLGPSYDELPSNGIKTIPVVSNDEEDHFMQDFDVEIKLIHEKIHYDTFEFAELEEQRTFKALGIRNIINLKTIFKDNEGNDFPILKEDDIQFSLKFIEKDTNKKKDSFETNVFSEENFADSRIFNNEGNYLVGPESAVKRRLF